MGNEADVLPAWNACGDERREGSAGLSGLVDLPSPSVGRWTVRRKSEILSAVRKGVISLEEVRRIYDISLEEYLSWDKAMRADGHSGLRATRRPAVFG